MLLKSHLSSDRPENDDPVYFSYFLIDPRKGELVEPLYLFLIIAPIITGVQFPRMGFPLLGIDHINKNPKRTRYAVEKAIKIHN